MSEPRPTLHVPARDIPIPNSVSAEAQAVLAMGPLPATEYPPLDDVDAWRFLIANMNDSIAAGAELRAANVRAKTQLLDVDGVRVYEVTPSDVDLDDGCVYLDIHGGAFIYGSEEACRAMGVNNANWMGARLWTVDYRMPPDHPYPAGLDDCLIAYRALLRDHRPDQIIVGGASAGGNLAAAMTLRARDEGLPLPAAVVLCTPGVDLTESSDSLHTNLGLDPLLTGSARLAFLLYAGGQDLKHPYVSPVYGDFTLGFPPTILTTGTRDLLLSDTVRMHAALRAADVAADLYVTEAGGHGGFFGTAPEDHAMMREVRRFVDRHWGR